MILICYRTIFHDGIAVQILIWDPRIGVLGSSVFDVVEF
jgi:hypothetical protein